MIIRNRDHLLAVMEDARERLGLSYQQVKTMTNSGTSNTMLDLSRTPGKDVFFFASLLPILDTLGLELVVQPRPRVSKLEQRRTARRGLQQRVGSEPQVGGGNVHQEGLPVDLPRERARLPRA